LRGRGLVSHRSGLRGPTKFQVVWIGGVRALFGSIGAIYMTMASSRGRSSAVKLGQNRCSYRAHIGSDSPPNHPIHSQHFRLQTICRQNFGHHRPAAHGDHSCSYWIEVWMRWNAKFGAAARRRGVSSGNRLSCHCPTCCRMRRTTSCGPGLGQQPPQPGKSSHASELQECVDPR
jgi:hypothetical protein